MDNSNSKCKSYPNEGCGIGGNNADTSKDHLMVTSKQSRNADIHDVEVVKIMEISPTVKHLVLHSNSNPPNFTFKPGQWIDMFIPRVEQVGGFSITSSPSELRNSGNLHLAVKYSESPPSKWIHSHLSATKVPELMFMLQSKCQEGSRVSIRVGGDFFMDKAGSGLKNILLIAGGVGINPLASMISELECMGFENDSCSVKAALLFSAKNQEELIFKDQFDAIAAKHPNFKPYYFMTSSEDKSIVNSGPRLERRRISINDIQHVLGECFNVHPHTVPPTTDNVSAYVCGPPDMITTTKQYLTGSGVRKLFYENWW